MKPPFLDLIFTNWLLTFLGANHPPFYCHPPANGQELRSALTVTAGCGDELGDWLSQFTWAAMTGVALGFFCTGGGAMCAERHKSP